MANWNDEFGVRGKAAAKEYVNNLRQILKEYETPGAFRVRYVVPQADDEAEQSSPLIEKLRRLKTKYDPYNIFSQNVNIKPDVVPPKREIDCQPTIDTTALGESVKSLSLEKSAPVTEIREIGVQESFVEREISKEELEILSNDSENTEVL
jgi:hypothetical protein